MSQRMKNHWKQIDRKTDKWQRVTTMTKKAENLKKKVQASEIHLKQFRVECVTFGAKVDDLSVQQISGWLDHWSTRLFAGANTHTQHFTCFSQNRSMKLAHRIKWTKTHTHTHTHTRTQSQNMKNFSSDKVQCTNSWPTYLRQARRQTDV